MTKCKVVQYFSVFLLLGLIPLALSASYSSSFFSGKTPQHSAAGSGRTDDIFKNQSFFRDESGAPTVKDEDGILNAPPTFPDDGNNYNPGGKVGEAPLEDHMLFFLFLPFIYIAYQGKSCQKKDKLQKETIQY
ncbi:MAG: hypothetical protein LUG18_09835 [Candidatus Azobacteroides sp.]|nr:hypothetical protein [Candidatus Azobacteroides sp.]